MAAETIWLERPAEDIPWGFRLQGGIDYHYPLSVQRVTGGSIASTGLQAGDVILRIGDTDTTQLTHSEAMVVIKNAGNQLQLSIVRPGQDISAGASNNFQPSSAMGYQPTPPAPPVPQLSPSTGSGAYRSLSNDYYANSMSPGVAANAYDSPSAAALSPSTSDYPFGSPSTMGGGGGGFLNGGVGTEQPDYYSGGAATGYDDTSGYYGSPSGKAMSPDTTGYGSLSPSSQPTKTPPVVPDAILNMAAKGPQDKKPFAYVGDVNDIREQRERMRRRTTPGGSSSLPRYQHMLNMPQFEDPAPVARTIRSVHGTPPPAERQSSGGGGGGGGDQNDAAIVSNLQFNTPIGLYSGDNVVEALQGQTGGQVSGVVGLPKKDKNDFTQSAVYKMIHGLDQPKQRPPVGFIDASQHQSTPPRQPSVDDETRFSGLQSRNDIPSKSFQRLQSWTGNNGPGGPVGQNVGGSEIDTTSIRRNVAGALGSDSEQDPGQYNEKSIRYTGRNIPGRSFKMLQQMTGGPQSTDSYASPARELASDDDVRSSGGLRSRSETPSRTYQPQQQQQQPANVGGSEIDYSSIRHNLLQASDGGSGGGGGGGEGQGDVGQYDQTSIRYQGKSIPSRSFRMLQQMTGGDPGTPPVQQPTSVRAPRQPAQHHQQQQQPRRYRTPSGGEQPHQPQPTAASDDGSAQQQQPKRDIRYTGGSIPSQSFRMLQQSIGVDSEAAAAGANAQQPQVATAGAVNGGDTLQSAGGRQVKVVRLRSQASTEDTGATEF